MHVRCSSFSSTYFLFQRSNNSFYVSLNAKLSLSQSWRAGETQTCFSIPQVSKNVISLFHRGKNIVWPDSCQFYFLICKFKKIWSQQLEKLHSVCVTWTGREGEETNKVLKYFVTVDFSVFAWMFPLLPPLCVFILSLVSVTVAVTESGALVV